MENKLLADKNIVIIDDLQISDNYCDHDNNILTNNQLKEFYDKRKDDIEALLSCPVTGFFPLNPVVASDGIIYEKDAIEHCLMINGGKSPLSGQKMSNDFKKLHVWSDIIKMFRSVDPELKDMMNEISYKFVDNLFTIQKTMGNKKYDNLFKYTHFDLQKVIINTFFGKSIFHCSDLKIIKHVLDNSIDTTFCHNNGQTSLISWACANATTEVLEYLESRGFDMFDKKYKGYPIINILVNTNVQFIGKLKDAVLNIITKNGYKIDNFKPIAYAIITKNFNLLKLLMENNFVIEDYCINGSTCTIIDLLYKYFFKPDMYFYVIKKVFELKPELIYKPIKYDKNNSNVTHRLLNLSIGNLSNNLDFLISLKNVNMETKNANGWTPIHYVCIYGNYSDIEKMMKLPIDLTTTCNYNGIQVPALNLIQQNNKLTDMERFTLTEKFFEIIEMKTTLAKFAQLDEYDKLESVESDEYDSSYSSTQSGQICQIE
jgi:hypothetical protein